MFPFLLIEKGSHFLRLRRIAMILAISENEPMLEKITPTQFIKKFPPSYGSQIVAVLTITR